MIMNKILTSMKTYLWNKCIVKAVVRKKVVLKSYSTLVWNDPDNVEYKYLEDGSLGTIDPKNKVLEPQI